MPIDPGTAFSIGAALIGVAASWGTTKQRIDNQKEQLDGYKGQLSKIWDWKDGHERETQEYRLLLQSQLGELKGEMARRDGQYTEIIRQLTALVEKIDRFERRIDDLHQNKN